MQWLMSLFFGGSVLFAQAPSSATYQLKSYDFGGGGTDSSSSASYKVNGNSGGVGDAGSVSATYTAISGLTPTQQANVPPAPSLSNPDGYYERLKIVLNTGSNPADTKFLIAISSDNFTTTKYIQTDNSIGSSYTVSSFQTYNVWGGASGFFVTGLTQSTTYEVCVRAFQGAFSDSGFGPKSAAVATLAPSLSFGLSTTLTSTPPYAVNFSSLAAGTVYAGNADALVSLSSNARLGNTVYISGANAGLRSAAQSYTLSSVSADLASAAAGFGAQVVSASQMAGAAFGAYTPYNGATDNIGALATSPQPILGAGGPMFGGSSTIRFKAKSDSLVPASSDYTETVSIIAAINL